jgi:hypothetical protein
MTWEAFLTFLWGSAVVLVDAVTGPARRKINQHRRSTR